ncbi:MAG: chromosome segregation protein SMC [Actinomycetia bacterium]|nr:chromosome segregation protein SMC [Actinomycetes bacterium]
MHLKTLTLRGFKSFASATTLRFEPGITAVVGPNGSGKSNVVDAIAWVLGEQGAKALRGGKMEDVIFAGTAGRPPLGRAEVTLTIDNSDNALPIDYVEVSLTRRMFRDGASEYEINGESCRLLDIQELLSDSGIGREMHVIVGQGQLDSILAARPEERRGFIEEAAGVLKHRKRKEKALRKLDAMEVNLNRLTDLTAELRRQLRPLGRQAEVARRAAGVQAELRDSRLRLLADDLTRIGGQLEREVADEQAARARRAQVEGALAAARAGEAELEQAMVADAPALAVAQDTWARLTALEERFRGTVSLAAERARNLSAPPEEAPPGRDPEQLEAEAARAGEQEAELGAELSASQQVLAAALTHRQEQERALAAAERELLAATRAVADRREGLAKLVGQVNALRARAAAAADELTRLGASAADARERAGAAEAQFARERAQVGALDDGEVDLDARHEAAVAALEQARAAIAELTEQQRDAERDRSTWTARHDALALGLTRKDGAGALLAAGSRLPGVLGSVAALLTVDPGQEAALAAALGALAEAVAVASADDAVAALELLKADDAGRAGLLIGGPPAGGPESASGSSLAARGARPPLPSGAVWAGELVRAPERLRAALDRALEDVVVVADLAEARALIARAPRLRAVTRGGDALGAGWAAGGSATEPSVLEVRAAVDEARQNADQAAARQARLSAELAGARTRADAAKAGSDAALAALNESDARLAAVTERLGELGQRARAATAEAARIDQARVAAAQARDRDLAGLNELEERLRLAQAEPARAEPSTAERDERAVSLAQARQVELDARLAVRTGEERVRSLTGRAESLLRAAQAERAARHRREATRRARAQGASDVAAVRDVAERVLGKVSESAQRAAAEREQAQLARADREARMAELRARTRELDGQLAQLTDAVHRDEVARAEQRMRVEQLRARAGEEFGVEVDALLAEYGPQAPCPPSAQEMAEFEQARERGESVVAPQPGPFHRPTQERRAARAERDLALLGKVNPLALEEFAALEERHQFLSTQLEDLKATRRDLLTVVKEVDDRILEVFASAYHDVAREFETVFATLFPGGAGRLMLTDPDDMLTTGVEVEARPPGKKVKRLSLLSGGERALTAVALLVAIFRARPSPFYVMDEVEAALDDVNLSRLLGLVSELRASSQLIIITHQKRTMELADALYGTTMRGDGITQLISQRLRESE